jgi:HSP20 family protein
MLFPLTRWNSAREMQRFQEQLDSLFASRSGEVYTYPPVNVWTNDESVIVSAELPGMELENLDISVHGETLTIRGGRARQELKEGDKFQRRERLVGSFSRTLQLPFRVDTEKVDAHFNRGVLTVKLPRAEADKPRKITVRPA